MQGAIYPSLKDRTVLVTGGGSGIGEAIVRQFVGQGSRVGFIDIDVKASKQVLASLPAHASVHFEHADLRDIGALRRAVAGVREAFGPITILVNNAARDDRHAIEDVTPEYWDERIAVNLKHQFFSAQAVAPDMIQTGGGTIVNIGSAAGLTNIPFLPTYSASKAALHSLTQAARILLGAQGTSVFGVYAGPVDTDMTRGLAMPKTSPRDVAFAIIDGIEAGQEDIFPDPFAVDFGRRFQSSPKASERQIAAMVSGSAA